MLDTIIAAIALVLLLEGLFPLLFPNRWLNWIKLLSETPPEKVRGLGMFMLGLAGICVFLLRLIG